MKLRAHLKYAVVLLNIEGAIDIVKLKEFCSQYCIRSDLQHFSASHGEVTVNFNIDFGDYKKAMLHLKLMLNLNNEVIRKMNENSDQITNKKHTRYVFKGPKKSTKFHVGTTK